MRVSRTSTLSMISGTGSILTLSGLNILRSLSIVVRAALKKPLVYCGGFPLVTAVRIQFLLLTDQKKLCTSIPPPPPPPPRLEITVPVGWALNTNN